MKSVKTMKDRDWIERLAELSSSSFTLKAINLAFHLKFTEFLGAVFSPGPGIEKLLITGPQMKDI